MFFQQEHFMGDAVYFFFLQDFLMWTILEVFIEFVTILLLFYVLVFWLQFFFVCFLFF